MITRMPSDRVAIPRIPGQFRQRSRMLNKILVAVVVAFIRTIACLLKSKIASSAESGIY